MSKIQIEETQNGYILSWEEEWEAEIEEAENESKTHTVKHVVEVKEDCSDESYKEALTEVFLFLAEHFGETYDKYGEENLNIKWNGKGRKV